MCDVRTCRVPVAFLRFPLPVRYPIGGILHKVQHFPLPSPVSIGYVA